MESKREKENAGQKAVDDWEPFKYCISPTKV